MPQKYEVVGFLDDDASRHNTSILGAPVLGPLDKARSLGDVFLVNGIGSSRTYLRKPEIIGKTGLSDERFETIVHPSAQVSPSAVLGAGTVVLPNVTIASRVKVGTHVIILPNSVLSH